MLCASGSAVGMLVAPVFHVVLGELVDGGGPPGSGLRADPNARLRAWATARTLIRRGT